MTAPRKTEPTPAQIKAAQQAYRDNNWYSSLRKPLSETDAAAMLRAAFHIHKRRDQE